MCVHECLCTCVNLFVLVCVYVCLCAFVTYAREKYTKNTTRSKQLVGEPKMTEKISLEAVEVVCEVRSGKVVQSSYEITAFIIK